MPNEAAKDAMEATILKSIDDHGSIQLSIYEAGHTCIKRLVAEGTLIYYDAYMRGHRFVVEVSRPGFDGVDRGHFYKPGGREVSRV